MKRLFITIITFIIFILLSPKAVFAGTLKLNLSKLPEYKNTTNFRLYYTYFETESKVATVNLYIQKDGKDWRQTNDKNKTTVSGYFQLEGADIYDGEGKYNFYAAAATADQTVNSENVSTTLDMSPPSAPTEYSKERVNATTYKLNWKNPFDADFEKVYIYRSKEKSFVAEASTRIGEAGGSKDEKITFNDGSVEADVEYFYALRAIDQAGNASGIVTDAPGTVTAGQVAGITTLGQGGPIQDGAEGEVKILPKEKATPVPDGQLGGGISSEAGEVKGETDNKNTVKKVIFGVAALGIVLVALYLKNRKKD